MRDSNEQSLKEVLKNMVERMRLKPKLYETRIQEIWQTKMGTTIAGNTKGLKIRNNKLFLTIESSSLKQELSYSKDKIKEMVNKELGEDFIKDVIIR